ncbi:MAG: eCIS core domain-containing protein [Chitinophaga sp.]
MKKEMTALPKGRAPVAGGPPFFQPKLTVNEPGDTHEQQADAMAEQVMRMPDPQPAFSGNGASGIQRKCAACEQEEKEQAHRKPLADGITPVQRHGAAPVPAVGARTESAINSSRGGGQGLPSETRGFMESRFGRDFGDVRVHADDHAAQLSDTLSARAFTTGNDIFFNKGQYAPQSSSGRQLLAHELTHVVQQNGALSRKVIQRYPWPYRLRMRREVNESQTETISNAPAAFSAWNGTFAWDAKFTIDLDAIMGRVTLLMRLSSTAPRTVRRAWERAIERKWSNRMYLRITPPGVSEGPCKLPIVVNIRWVTDPARAHYTINPQAAGATTGGRAGLGGTTSMTDWGTADTVDVTHEFGHMIGNPEEYFTTNGTNYATGSRAGFRDPGGGIMNNPAERAHRRHFNLLREQVAAMLRLNTSRVRVIYDNDAIPNCRADIGDFPVPQREPGDFPVMPGADTGERYA